MFYGANIMLLHTLSYLAPLVASIHEEKWKLIIVKLILLGIVVLWQRKSGIYSQIFYFQHRATAADTQGYRWTNGPSMMGQHEPGPKKHGTSPARYEAHSASAGMDTV